MRPALTSSPSLLGPASSVSKQGRNLDGVGAFGQRPARAALRPGAETLPQSPPHAVSGEVVDVFPRSQGGEQVHVLRRLEYPPRAFTFGGPMAALAFTGMGYGSQRKRGDKR